MSFPDGSRHGRDETSSGNSYKDFHIGGGTNHIGNSYTFRQDNLLSSLPNAEDAPFNSYSKQYHPTCLENTRVELLQEIYEWAERDDKQSIFWLSGLAGTGKSTIARTIARKYFDQKCLGASFFFSRGGGDVGHAGKFVTSIALQLASNIPSINQHICNAIREQTNIVNQSLHDQWHQLVLHPLSKLNGRNCRPLYVLVVDALDECDEDDNIRNILQLFAEVRSFQTVQIRIFLTSRPEISIRHGFYHMSDTEHKDFILHTISPSIIDYDIRAFLEYNLRLVGQERSLGSGWPGEDNIRYLVQGANGLFIWAATACRFIREGKRFAARRLETILNSSGSASTAPEKQLDKIYTTVLKNSISAEYTDEEKEELYSTLRQILGSIAVLLSPLPVYSLSRLLHVTNKDIDQTLEELHSVLYVPKDQSQPLRLHHPSFRDFLLNSDRCNDVNVWVDEKQANQTLADMCIELMSSSLKQDICGLGAPGMLMIDLERSQVERCLSPELQYACLYWIQHIKQSRAQLQDNDRVHNLLQEHLLHWVEALGWMGRTSEGVLALISLESYILADKSPDLHAFVQDARRFVLYNRSMIEQAPLQIYCSAIIFGPEKSTVRSQFETCVPGWIQTTLKVQGNWTATLQTLEGHTSAVSSVAFSPDGKLVASGSSDKTVRLWDAATGAARHILMGHLEQVTSVAFSPDSKLLVSASYDNTARLWDVTTGEARRRLEGHSEGVCSVVFSPDGKPVVTGSWDGTVRHWDSTTGVEQQMTLEADSRRNWIMAVAISSNGKLIVSGSVRNMVTLRDTVTRGILWRLRGHTDAVESVAFSPDGKLIVSGSRDNTVRLWDTETGVIQQTLKGHTGWVHSVAFSPDGKLVISGSEDKTIRLWNVAAGVVRQTLKGHTDCVYSVAFSPDGKLVISGSNDMTIRLWDTAAGVVQQTLERHSGCIASGDFSTGDKLVASGPDDEMFKGHSEQISSVAFSPDGKLAVSGSYDKTLRLWNPVTGTTRHILRGHSSPVISAAFSPDNKLVISGSDDNTARLWDAATGVARQTLEGDSYSICSVVFSVDSKIVASGSFDGEVRLWDAVTGAALQTLEGHEDAVRLVAFSPDGRLFASGSDDESVQLWKMTRAGPQTLKAHLGWVRPVEGNPSGKPVVLKSRDETVQFLDIAKGLAHQTGSNYESWMTSLAFLPDSKLIILLGGDGTFRLWETATGAARQMPEGHSNVIESLAVLPGMKCVYNLSMSNDWVMEGETKILWIPPYYRSACVAIRDRIIALGDLSGNLFFLKFRKGSKYQ